MVETAQQVTGLLLKGPGKIYVGINMSFHIDKWKQLRPEHLLSEIKQN